MDHVAFTLLFCLFAALVQGAASGTVRAEDRGPAGSVIKPEIADKGKLPEHPIVFVSRERQKTWKKVHVGPPVDLQGRELTPGGRLLVWRPDGSVTDLSAGTGLFDVQQPDVTFDAQRVVFSAVTKPGGKWHLWEMKLDGSGLRQLTFEDRDIVIPTDPRNPGFNKKAFMRYGDFAPCCLPDGRILFVSTRYPTLSGSCGQRGLNLHVLDPATGAISRRTTERAAALDPYVLKDGRIIFSHWMDAMNLPSDIGPGLKPLRHEYNFVKSPWGIWSMNPDGSHAGRYAYLEGDLLDLGGVHQPRELADGNIIVSYRWIMSLIFDTLPSSVTILRPGAEPFQELEFLGDPYKEQAPHAMCPAPLPDGRIAVSYTKYSRLTVNHRRVRSAHFDFGIYIADKTLKKLFPLYNDPARDELDAIPVVVRSAPVIPDGPDADRISDDPAIDMGMTATLINHNVYADLPLDVAPLPSPRVGTVAWIDVYDDGMSFTTTPEFPLPEKQMPRLVGRYPVKADGSFKADVPADRPLLFLLVNKDGVAVRSPLAAGSPGQKERSVVHSFNGHDFLRPHNTIQCTGCHKGHMLRPELVMQAQSNLARLAKASASSHREPFAEGAHRINDLRLPDSEQGYSWMTTEDPGCWARLDWAAPVTVERVLVYPVSGQSASVTRSSLRMSDGTSLSLPALPEDGSPFEVKLDKPHSVSWILLTVEGKSTSLAGLAEIVVNGPAAKVKLPDTPPSPPVSLEATDGTVRVTWERNKEGADEPAVAGYRIFYGGKSGAYDKSIDVGNVTESLLSAILEDGGTYYLRAKAYNVHGTESEGKSKEVKVTVHAPKIYSILPDHGPTGGRTPITIKGDHFSPEGVRAMFDDHYSLLQIQVVDGQTITAMTRSHYVGPVNIKVMNPDDQSGTLENAFTYE